MSAWPRGGGCIISLGSGKIGQSRSQCTVSCKLNFETYFSYWNQIHVSSLTNRIAQKKTPRLQPGNSLCHLCSVCVLFCPEQFVKVFSSLREVFSPEVVWAHHL